MLAVGAWLRAGIRVGIGVWLGARVKVGVGVRSVRVRVGVGVGVGVRVKVRVRIRYSLGRGAGRVRYVTTCLAVRHAGVRQAPLVARAGGDIAAGLAEPGVSIVVVAEGHVHLLAAAHGVGLRRRRQRKARVLRIPVE